MTGQLNTVTSRVIDFITKKYIGSKVAIQPVTGGYSRNRRAIIEVGGNSFFAKEVDVDLLPSDGKIELGWLKKDFEMISELSKRGISIAPDWAKLELDGHLLLMPSFKKEDGWRWSPPEDKSLQASYIQAVIDATQQLEATILPDTLTERLSLQPFFRDEIAHYEGIAPLFTDQDIRSRLIYKYKTLHERKDHLQPAHALMLETLSSDEKLSSLQNKTSRLEELPNSCLNHCDVRSDNVTFNEFTGEVKFVDWNWASYAPAKFGATEFLLDMARRGIDVSRWHKNMSRELLAASVGYFMIRSLKAPLSPGSTLREMQAETAAVANYLHRQFA